MSQLHTSVGFMSYFENTVRLLSGKWIGKFQFNENQLNQVVVSMQFWKILEISSKTKHDRNHDLE